MHRDTVDAHLDGCADCRALVSMLTASAELDGSPGDRIASRYEVLGPLGAGAMGVVVRAYDPELDRIVAVKLLRTDASDPVGRARLIDEAKAMARIADPHVVAVYDAGALSDEVFIAMELVDGMSLRRWLAAAHRSTTEILDVFRQAARGLDAAHRAGLVHRDFKPENVLIGEDGRVRVGDFGLARTQPAMLAPGEHHALHSRSGPTAGTPGYMAPEQHRGGIATARSDQFAFCVALWEALTGERPFAGDSRQEIARAVIAGQRRPLPRAIPRHVRRVLVRGLATASEDRFASMAAVVEALVPPRLGVIGWSVAAVCTLGAVIAVIVLATRSPGDACEAVGQAAARVDGPERREALRVALEAAGPFGHDAWTSASQTLRRWADDWSSARVAACRDERAGTRLSAMRAMQRARCLDGDLANAVSVVDALAAGGRAAALRAGELPSLLGTSAACADQLVDGDDELIETARDREIRAALVAANAAWMRGDLHAVRVGLDRARRSSGVVHDHAQEAMLLLKLAQAEWQETNAELVEPRMRAAMAEAEAAGADRIKVQAMAQLATVLIERQRVPEAIGWMDQALATLRRLGGDPRLAVEIRVTRASLLVRQDRNQLAELVTTVADAERVLAPDDKLLPASLLDLALARQQTGDLTGALVDARRGAASAERVFGPRHPSTAEALNFPAGLLSELERYDEAQPIFERAVAICLESGCGAEGTTRALKNLATNELRRGKLDAALAHLEQAHRLPDARQVGRARRGELSAELGEVLVALRRWSDAVSALAEARELFEHEPAADLELVIDARLDEATALRALDRLPEADAARRAASELAIHGDLDPESRARVTARLRN